MSPFQWGEVGADEFVDLFEVELGGAIFGAEFEDVLEGDFGGGKVAHGEFLEGVGKAGAEFVGFGLLLGGGHQFVNADGAFEAFETEEAEVACDEAAIDVVLGVGREKDAGAEGTC